MWLRGSNAAVGRVVLLPGACWVHNVSNWPHLFYFVLYKCPELRRARFHQARVTQAVLPPGALFHHLVYNGSEVPQGRNRQKINAAQQWVKNVFCHWLEVAQKWVQSGLRGLVLHKIGPETHFGPTFGPLPANDEKPIFDPLCATLIV